MKAFISEMKAQIVGDGAFVSVDAITHLAVDDPRLRCLDLVNSPTLESLDLSACQSPAHLTVRGCPNLSYVRLPAGGEGACIHWDFGTGGVSVHIEGSIALFDCCHDDGRTAKADPLGEPYVDGVVRTGIMNAAQSQEFREHAELLVSFETGLVDPHALQQCHPQLRALHLLGSVLPQTIDLHGPNLEFVAIADSRDLTRIIASVSVARLSLLRCSLVSHIVNSGDWLRVEGGRAPELKLEGAWNHAHFVRTASKLVSGPIEDVTAHGCPHIRPELVSLANASNPLAFLPNEDCIRDPQWRSLIIGWIERTTNRATILPALKLTGVLIETGFAPEAGWQLRCKLAHNTARKAFKARCQELWSWDTPEDLAFETYTEDLTLWLRCRSAPGVPDFDAKLQTARGAMQIATLVRQARSTDRLAQRLCLEAAYQAMEHIGSRDTCEATDGQITIAIKRTIETLVPARALPEAPAVLARLPRFIRTVAADDLCLEALSALAALGLSAANVELVRRSRELAAEKADLAARFHAAAFAPRKADILTHIAPEVFHA